MPANRAKVPSAPVVPHPGDEVMLRQPRAERWNTCPVAGPKQTWNDRAVSASVAIS